MARAYTQTTHRYTAVFEPAEEGGYTVTIPALPGCISEADTFEEAVKNIQEAAELYLEVMRDEHEAVPEEQSATFTVPLKVRA